MTVYSDGSKIVTVTPKDPDDVDTFGFDWSDRLATGETITTSTWILPDGLTEDDSSNTTTVTSVKLSGGTAETMYTITNRITTTDTHTWDRSMKFFCSDK